MRESRYVEEKSRIISLRRRGKSYGEIRRILGIDIPKSTLSNWCVKVTLPHVYQKRIAQLIRKGGHKGRATALAVNRVRREQYLKSVEKRISHLSKILSNKDVAKIAIAMLYLGEGAKDPKRGAASFGNSDPLVIDLFISLLRYSYDIDESKFRCKVQCRADQDIKKLEKFWARITGIPLKRFNKTWIDPRTIGKPSKKLDYKGVCVIVYLSADMLTELLKVPEVLHKGARSLVVKR